MKTKVTKTEVRGCQSQTENDQTIQETVSTESSEKPFAAN